MISKPLFSHLVGMKVFLSEADTTVIGYGTVKSIVKVGDCQYQITFCDEREHRIYLSDRNLNIVGWETIHDSVFTDWVTGKEVLLHINNPRYLV